MDSQLWKTVIDCTFVKSINSISLLHHIYINICQNIHDVAMIEKPNANIYNVCTLEYVFGNLMQLQSS